MSPFRSVAGGVEVALKVVPGASRSALAGLLGDRLKVRIAAPPEGGKANRAVCDLFQSLAGCPVRLVSGAGQPLKTILLVDLDTQTAERLLLT